MLPRISTMHMITALMLVSGLSVALAEPRQLQYSGSWYGNVVMGITLVKTGTEYSNTLFVCRGEVAEGQYLTGKRFTYSTSCNVAVGGVEVVVPSGKNHLLKADDSMIWANTVPQDGLMVQAGTYLGKPTYICRALHPVARSGPHGGYITQAGNGVNSCVFAYGGKNVTVASPNFDYLFSLPSNSTSALPAGAVPVVPSASPTPSNFPSPSVTPTPMTYSRSIWVNASQALSLGYDYHHFVKAGSEDSFNIYACRAVLPNRRGTVGGKWEIQWEFCDVPFDQIEFVDADYQLLVKSPYIAWSSYPLPPGAQPLISGNYDGWPTVNCRAWHPSIRSGPHSGYTTYVGAALPPLSGNPEEDPYCVFSYGGGVVHSYDFQILAMLPTSIANAGVDGTGAWNGSSPLLQPSVSPQRSPSPSPTSSPSAITPGRLEWWNYTSGAMPAGVDSGKNVYVCRGYLPNGELIPGKFLDGFTFCDIPWRNVEFVDVIFEALRWNPLLAWNATVPKGAVAVKAGTYEGMDLTVCRAYHPTLRSGPHAGYTDGELYNGAPLCFVSYGGKIIRTAPFDYLYMLPVPSPSPSPVTPSPSPSPATLSVTSTPSASYVPASVTATGSPSVVASPSKVGSGSVTTTSQASTVPTPSSTRTSAASAANTPAATGASTSLPTPSAIAASISPSPAKAAGQNTRPSAVPTSEEGTTAIHWMVGILVSIVIAGAAFYVYKAQQDNARSFGAPRASAATTTSESSAIIAHAQPAEPWVPNDPRFHYPAQATRTTNAHV